MLIPLPAIRYASALVFGVLISADFEAIKHTRKNLAIIFSFCFFIMFLQNACWRLFGYDFTNKMYPFITHLPLALLLIFVFKRSAYSSIASVFSAYLCCQISRWVGAVCFFITDAQTAEHLSYILSFCVIYYLIKRYVAGPAHHLMGQSKTACLLFGAIPGLYYIFDYTTTVYTDLLFTGSKAAVQFMPSIVATFYFVFVLIYYLQIERQQQSQRERDLLSTQLVQAKNQFETIRTLSESTAVHRHDLRHHFALLQGYVAAGSLDKIQEYLKNAQENIDAITPQKYCSNYTVNLILSSFAAKASSSNVVLKIIAAIPENIPLSDTEICALLSNGIENAISAVCNISDITKRVVTIKISIHKNKLLVLIQNPYIGEVQIQDGIPLSTNQGHGYGTKSILAITNSNGGQVIFSAENNIFSLKVMLPVSIVDEPARLLFNE